MEPLFFLPLDSTLLTARTLSLCGCQRLGCSFGAVACAMLLIRKGRQTVEHCRCGAGMWLGQELYSLFSSSTNFVHACIAGWLHLSEAAG